MSHRLKARPPGELPRLRVRELYHIIPQQCAFVHPFLHIKSRILRLVPSFFEKSMQKTFGLVGGGIPPHLIQENTTILSPCFLTCRYSNHRKTILFNIISLCANQTTIISDIIYFVPLPFRSGIPDFLKPVTARKSTPAYVYYTKRNYNAG